jgi:hypothetical protein
MKIRTGFVSNSSSCSFAITNISDSQKSLVDFVIENPQLIEQFLEEFDWYKKYPDEYNQDKLIESAIANDETFLPGETKYCILGDEQGTLIGHVMDYQLRDGGSSESFTWRLDEMLR